MVMSFAHIYMFLLLQQSIWLVWRSQTKVVCMQAADYSDGKGSCQFIAKHKDDTVALAKNIHSSMNMTSSPNGRKLQSAAGTYLYTYLVPSR